MSIIIHPNNSGVNVNEDPYLRFEFDNTICINSRESHEREVKL